MLVADAEQCYLHDAQAAVVHGRHDEALGLVIQVLPEEQLVVAVLPAAAVQSSALHSAAEGADRVSLHVRVGHLEDPAAQGRFRDTRRRGQVISHHLIVRLCYRKRELGEQRSQEARRHLSRK